MDVGREIAAALTGIEEERAIEVQEQRYQEARAVIATIPSGTRDDDLTSKQRCALDQYKDATRRLTALRRVAEQTDALAFKLIVTCRGCQIHDDPLDCEPPIQAAHILSKQALRRHGHGDKLWDTRNGLGACYRAHRRSDAALERFPVEHLPDAFWEFADEVGLRYLAEKHYGRKEVAA